MEPATYRSLVAALESDAQRDPLAVRTRLIGYVVLGYAYVFAIVGTIVAAMAALAWLATVGDGVAAIGKVFFVLAALLILVLRSLRVKVESPTGTLVTHSQAPRFLERVEQIRSSLGAPKPDRILLTEDFNASVTQVPQLGLLGVLRTYIVIGIPLLYALTPSQFDAVLAHEFGHLSGSHPKRGLRVFRIARVWDQLMHQLDEQGSWGSFLFRWFFHWYVPRLNAYAFVISRRDELEADADAARVTSAASMGSALVATAIRGRFLGEKFWRDIWEQANVKPEPVEAWRSMPERLRQSDQLPIHREWLTAALLETANENDTHPSLQTRLSNLGLLSADSPKIADSAEALVASLETSAAAHYLPELASQRLEALETDWRTQVAQPWTERYEGARKMRTRFSELSTRDRANNDLSADEVWEMAGITSSLEGDLAAVPLTQRVLALREEHAPAHFLLGRTMFEAKDASCEAHLHRAMELDPDAVPAAGQLLGALYRERGDAEGLTRIQQRYDDWYRFMGEARAERDQVFRTDRFEAPSLTEDEILKIRAAIRSFGGIEAVHVGRKVTKHYADRPLLVLLIQRPWLESTLRSVPKDLSQRFADTVALECEHLVFTETNAIAWVRKLIRRGSGLVIRT